MPRQLLTFADMAREVLNLAVGWVAPPRRPVDRLNSASSPTRAISVSEPHHLALLLAHSDCLLRLPTVQACLSAHKLPENSPSNTASAQTQEHLLYLLLQPIARGMSLGTDIDDRLQHAIKSYDKYQRLWTGASIPRQVLVPMAYLDVGHGIGPPGVKLSPNFVLGEFDHVAREQFFSVSGRELIPFYRYVRYWLRSEYQSDSPPALATELDDILTAMRLTNGAASPLQVVETSWDEEFRSHGVHTRRWGNPPSEWMWRTFHDTYLTELAEISTAMTQLADIRRAGRMEEITAQLSMFHSSFRRQDPETWLQDRVTVIETCLLRPRIPGKHGEPKQSTIVKRGARILEDPNAAAHLKLMYRVRSDRIHDGVTIHSLSNATLAEFAKIPYAPGFTMTPAIAIHYWDRFSRQILRKYIGAIADGQTRESFIDSLATTPPHASVADE